MTQTFQDRLATEAHLITLLMLRMNLSAVAFAGGQIGVIKRFLKPADFAKRLNSPIMKAGPLSVLITFGTPSLAKMIFRAVMAAEEVRRLVSFRTR